jgi:hypothetical protein
MPLHRRTALVAHAPQPETRQQKPEANAVEFGMSKPVVTP